MYPHERSLVNEMKDKPFALIGVNSDSVEDAKDAVQRNDLNWRSFQNSGDDRPDFSEDWAVEGWPTVVILDAERKIRYRGHDGMAATAVAEKLVEELAAKAQQ